MRYTVVVAEVTKDILAESIAIGFSRSGSVDLAFNKVVAIQELGNLLNEKIVDPDAVILVGRDGELEHYSTEILADFPNVVITRITICSEVVQMDVRQMDMQELVQSVCDLCQRRITSLEQRSNDYKIPLNETVAIDDGDCFKLEKGQTKSLLESVIEWLDGIIRVYLQSSIPASSDIPGLSVSRTTIESLLDIGTIRLDFGLENERADLYSSLTVAFEDATYNDDALSVIFKSFELTPIEFQAFLICIAPDLDSKYERIYGFINDDLGRRRASISLISQLLGHTLETRSQLAKSSLFNRWKFFGKQEANWPYSDESLRVDQSLVSWIHGNRSSIWQNDLLKGVITQNAWKGSQWLEDNSYKHHIADEFRQLLTDESAIFSWVVIQSKDTSFAKAVVESSVDNLTPLIRISLALLESFDTNSIEECIKRLTWAVRLTGSILAIDVSPSVSLQMMKRLVSGFEDVSKVCVLIVRDLVQVVEALSETKYKVFQVSPSSGPHPYFIYSKAVADFEISIAKADLERIAMSYPLPIEDIDRALRLASARTVGSDIRTELHVKDIVDACRDVSCPELPKFATALEPHFNLDDVVLPSDRRQMLDDIVNRIQHAETVLEDWGFGAQLPYGKGVAALFVGPSGTGKTMAAQAIGKALQRMVYAVDLSRVVNKYIGETEKNLDAVFYEAERAGAILLFDEADALFGKRSEVKDAHDRYANIEIAYLLQRMEAFCGLAILTSNFGKNMDNAFLRRLSHVVEFPLPDVMAREKIWRQCLPPGPHLAEGINFQFLARRIEINGGNIRQVTLRAAFSAAAEGVQINLNHLLAATRAEALKLGMPGLARDLIEQAA